MVRVIRNRNLFQRFFDNIHNFKLFGFLGIVALGAGVTYYLVQQQQDIRQRASGQESVWGTIANNNHVGKLTKGVFFFAGPPNPNSLQFYTRNPLDEASFNWSTEDEIDRVFDSIKQTGANVIKLSWWGTNKEHEQYAPTFNTTDIDHKVFTESMNRGMLVAPLIEVSPAFKFYDEFPTDTSKLELFTKHLLLTYGSHDNWLKIFDKNGDARKVIWLIETIHLGPVDTTQFAQAFDDVADKIEAETGQKVGFIIDPTPLPPNGTYEGPDPAKLLSINSILAVNPFNITSDGNTEQERLAKAEEILSKWKSSGIPLIAPVLPGYDDHVVRPPGQVYGDNPIWREAVKALATKYQTAGVTLDIWNGFTEGYAFAPTTQNQNENYELAKRVFESTNPTPVYFENEYLRVWDSRVYPGIIDLFYKDSSGNWKQYNNIVPIARVNGVWANSELDKSAITREIIENTPLRKIVKYQFTKLSNGAHFYLQMTLESGKKEVSFDVFKNDDSAPIDALALGNYYGLAQLVRYVKINNTVYDALSYPKPDPDGNYTLGRFIRLPFPDDKIVTFWGENGIVQKQRVETLLSGNDEMVVEVRYTPWLPEQTPPGKNWFETVHITRSPFDLSDNRWIFGIEDSPLSITPSPTGPVTCSTCFGTDKPYLCLAGGANAFCNNTQTSGDIVCLQCTQPTITPTPTKIPTPTPTKTPTPTPIPNCTTGLVCTGSCTATLNTCSTNNGILSGCSFTSVPSGGVCNATSAPNQPCTINNCLSGRICVSGSCLIPTSTPIPTPTLTPTIIISSPFKGEYFNNKTLTGTPSLTRNDASVNFDWRNSSPNSLIKQDGFSIRWTKIEYFAGGTYRFTFSNDDGMRMYIDGNLIYNNWRDQRASTTNITTSITQGNHSLSIQYYENRGNAVAKASWIRL